MELVSVLLYTLVGTAFGAAAAGFMLWRRTGSAPREVPAEPPSQQAAAVGTEDELRKQVSELERSLAQSRQEVLRKQQEYDQAVQRTAEESAARTAAERRVQELAARVADQEGGAARISVLQHSLEEAVQRTAEESAARIAAEQRVQELAARAGDHAEESGAARISELQHSLEEAVRRTGEESAARTAAEQRVQELATLEAQVEAQEQQIRDLGAEVIRLTDAWNLAKQSAEGKDRYASSLERELASGLARNEELNQTIARLQDECAQLENKLQDTSQAAAKKIEHLLATQDKFSKVFQELCLQSIES